MLNFTEAIRTPTPCGMSLQPFMDKDRHWKSLSQGFDISLIIILKHKIFGKNGAARIVPLLKWPWLPSERRCSHQTICRKVLESSERTALKFGAISLYIRFLMESLWFSKTKCSTKKIKRNHIINYHVTMFSKRPSYSAVSK